MPPVADQASLSRGRLPISGYKVSADWLEPTVYPFLGFPRTPFLSVAEISTGGALSFSPSWVISALRAAFGGCAPKRACGRSPAHTLHPQGVRGIRKAAKPLTAALPYRHGEFTTLSTISTGSGSAAPGWFTIFSFAAPSAADDSLARWRVQTAAAWGRSPTGPPAYQSSAAA